MIYSPDRGYLFVHIPKTGGTSMALALEAKARPSDILIGDTPKAQRRRKRVKALPAKGRLWKHSKLSDLDGWLTPDDFDALYVFTIVRNPWDRLVSYYHWSLDQNFSNPLVDLAKQISFRNFVLNPLVGRTFASLQSAAYVTDATGVERCDHYLRLENLDDELAVLRKELGLKLVVPHMVQSVRPADYREAYDDETTAAVAAFSADDIARFGYRFE